MQREVAIHWTPTKKQLKAFEILEDKETTEVLFGGSAGSGKSVLICVWLIYSCLKHVRSRWLMGRAVLKALKESTLLTFFQICNNWGLEINKDYKYNSIENIIKFSNGSTIYLKDLFAYPSDPEFNDLGSREYTGVAIDEGAQITAKAYNIIKSRIRFKLEEFGLIPKIIIASNPSKNFLYYDFYKPYRNKALPKYRKFVPALVGDNPYISPHYIESLKKLDEVSKQRLLYGNWEFDDDLSKLFDYDSIIDIFTNTTEELDKRFLSVDVARFGNDKTIIFQWKGFFIEKIYSYEKQSTLQTIKEIERIAGLNHIPRSRIVIDEDGLGGGVVDALEGVKGFVNNSRPIETRKDKLTSNYANLKSQCYFYLADYVNKSLIGCYRNILPKIKECLIEDLEQIKQKDPDKDGKIAITPKQEIKENLGRSNDYSDAMAMRMLFVIQKENKLFDLDKIEEAFK